MTWKLELPDLEYVTPNSRVHWAVRSRCGAAWREAAAWKAKQARIPAHDRIVVSLAMFPKDRRRRDADNLVSGVLKHVIDGLVDAGIVPDDDPGHVDARMPQIGPCEPTSSVHRWVVTVESGVSS